MLGFVVTLLTLAVPPAEPPAGPPAPRLDQHGFALPDGAVARLGRYDRRLRADGDWAAFADDGRTVARLIDGHLRLFELPSGRDVTPGYLKDFRNAQLAFLPDGRHLILSPSAGRCFVADPATGEPLVTLDVSDGRLASADCTPDGKRVLVRFYNTGDAGCAAVFDLSGRPAAKKVFRGMNYNDTWALGPDGAKLFHAWDRGVEAIDVTTGDATGGQYSRGRSKTEIAVAPDGRAIVTAGERGLGLYPVGGDGVGDPTHLDTDSSAPFALSEDGKTLFTFTRGRMELNGPLVEYAQEHDRATLRGCRFARYGKLAIDFFHDRPPVVWEPATGRTVFRFPEYGTVREVGFGKAGGVVVRHDDRAVREWRPDGRGVAERTGRVAAKGGDVSGVSRDGHALLERNPKTSGLVLTDAASGAVIADWPEAGSPTAVRLDPTGRYAVVASGKTAALRDPATGRRLRDVPASVTTDFSPDGRLLATAEAGEVRVTEVASGKERATLKMPATDFDTPDDQYRRYRSWDEDQTPQPPAGRFQLSADGRTLALFTTSGRVYVWSLADGSLLYREGGMGRPGGGRQAALRPDGKWVAYTLRTTRRLALRDVTEPRADRGVVFLPTLPSGVTTLAFTPDGKHLVSGHEDGLCLVWDVDAVIAGRPVATPGEPPADPWEALGDTDAKAAARAADELAAHPGVTVRLLEQSLRPDEKPTAAEVKAQVEQLGDADYATRERAEKRLLRWREVVVAELKAATAEAKEPEVQERLQRLVAAVDAADTDPERLRALRAVEVLERIGTPEAKRLLTRLAGGAAESLVTAEAKLAVERLAARGR